MKTKSLLPNIILSVILVGFLCLLTVQVNADQYSAQNQVQTSLPSEQVVYQASVEPIGIEWVDSYDTRVLAEKIEECQSRQDIAHQLAENARKLGHDESSPVIELARREWNMASVMEERFQDRMDSIIGSAPTEQPVEFHYANEVWKYLHNMGLNDWVSAGIIGNMMTECGGQTLALQPTADNGSHYGICQWSHYYYPEVRNKDFIYQCDYLRDTIEGEMNSFGFLYKQGFDYSDFCSLTDARKAAKAFAIVYERCGAGSYSVQMVNAEAAYEYFVG